MKWQTKNGVHEATIARNPVLSITRTAVVFGAPPAVMAYIRDDNRKCTWANQNFRSLAAAKRWAEEQLC